MITNKFYLALMARLITDNNIGLKHFDRFNNQLEMDEEDITFQYPAAFLELPENIPWRSVGRHKMIGVCNFNIRLNIESFDESDSSAGTDERERALFVDEIVNTVTAYLVGWSGEGFGSISRTGTVLDDNFGAIKEIVIPFKTLLTDKAAMKEVEKKKPGFDIIPK